MKTSPLRRSSNREAIVRKLGDALVFRCVQSDGHGDTAVDEWLTHWGKAGYPMRQRHWAGELDEPEPKWAGGAGAATADQCCCAASLAEGDVFEDVSKATCSSTWKGRCVDAEKCANRSL